MNIIFTMFSDLFDILFKVTGDYGVAIILLTLIVKIILLPMSIKNRVNAEKQQELADKMKKLKEQHRGNKERLNIELQELYTKNPASGMMLMGALIQVPIMISLYKVFSAIALEAGTIVVPWVSNLKLSDPYFIVPILATLVQILPNLLITIGLIKNTNISKLAYGNLIIALLINLVFIAKMPVAIGVYYITSNFLSALEQIIYSIYVSKKCAA